MSIGRHHAEWRELVEVSGPFLSMAVLAQVFPQGLDTVETELREHLRVAHEEWLDGASGPNADLAVHNAFIRYVFREALGVHEADILMHHPSLEVHVPEHRDTLRATFAVKNPEGRADAGKPRLFVTVLAPHEPVDKPPSHASVGASTWKLAPIDRMLYLLRGAQAAGQTARLGLVTNGDTWVLLYVAKDETTTYVRWSTELWFDEPLTLRAFVTFVGARRMFGVPDEETFEALVARSSKDGHEVTDRLGSQVRRATEVLVQTIDRVDRGRRGRLLESLAPVTVYEGAVTVMMRLIFVLAAEEKKLLLLGTPIYDQHYAVSTLHDQLQATADRHGEEILEKRFDAWVRLLSTFRAIFAGIEHDQLRMPAHGGSLFDPDRFPFLEGRAVGTHFRDAAQKAAEPLAVDNRTVLHLLRAITRLEVKVGGGSMESRRLSFLELDVEQIGHVYEGLLDHTAKRAEDVTVSLSGKLEPEIPLLKLESYKKKPDELVPYLVGETGRSTSAIEGAIQYKIPKDDDRKMLSVCENVSDTYERVKPWAGLIRKDTHGLPVVIPKGALYVTEGADRRSTGTHYTPRTLTEPIVQHTLDPLVYVGPAEGVPREGWKLKSAKDILALRVCDLAMGSGAFLVEACRYMAAKLVEAWSEEEERQGGKLLLAPDGVLSGGAAKDQAIPTDSLERLSLAKRYVADRCLYGVDVNPWAVEMGKLSLWLTTMQKGRPFSFLDHALRSGDSLLGVTDEKQLLHFHLDPVRGKKLHHNFVDVGPLIGDALAFARNCREKLEAFASDDITRVEQKQWLLSQARERTEDLRVVGDLLMGAALATAKKGDIDDLLKALSLEVARLLKEKSPEVRAKVRGDLKKKARELLDTGKEPQHAERRPFHWAVEFPEVMGRGGFEAFVGNPPFMGGLRVSESLGAQYNRLLVALNDGATGKTDLSCYFFRRSGDMIRPNGCVGLITTNSLIQGLNRRVSLDHLSSRGYRIVHATPSVRWPGAAAVEVLSVCLHNGPWKGKCMLGGKLVESINCDLTGGTSSRADVGGALPLKKNERRAYVGPFAYGDGFLLTKAEARSLIDEDPRNAEVISPYLIGQDINTDPEQKASRYIVAFGERTEREASAYARPFEHLRERVFPFRDAKDPPPRDMRIKTQWWKFFHPRLELVAALAQTDSICVRSQVSSHHVLAVVEGAVTPSHFVVVFLGPAWESFGVLQSIFHDTWVWSTASSLGGANNTRYIVRDCFLTFPFPDGSRADILTVSACAQRLHQERAEVLSSSRQGLTKLYNRIHAINERDTGIVCLRALHVALDQAVAHAYGWDDLRLDHGFHETKQGVRFTISEAARVEVLDRLLALNHERYAEEVKAGLHGDTKKSSKAAAKPSAKPGKTAAPTKGKAKKETAQQALLGEDEES